MEPYNLKTTGKNTSCGFCFARHNLWLIENWCKGSKHLKLSFINYGVDTTSKIVHDPI